MSKYIVELDELPTSCFECPLVQDDGDLMGENWCGLTEKDANNRTRRDDCPIKIIE